MYSWFVHTLCTIYNKFLCTITTHQHVDAGGDIQSICSCFDDYLCTTLLILHFMNNDYQMNCISITKNEFYIN